MLGVVRTCQPTMLFGVEVRKIQQDKALNVLEASFPLEVCCLVEFWLHASSFSTASYYTTCLFCLHSFILLLLLTMFLKIQLLV